MNKTYKQLRAEFNSKQFKRVLKDSLPGECVNCGCKEELEYHHIVPLAQGGTNRLSNIAVLCSRCHKAVHGEREARKYSLRGVSGRKPLSFDNSGEIFGKYFRCEITQKALKEAFGLPSGTRVTELLAYKEYVRDHKIVFFQNLVDIKITRGHRFCDRSVAGRIRFEGDAEERLILWGDRTAVAGLI